MSDYRAFVPAVNRPDLLLNVISAVKPLHDALTVIDNSPGQQIREALRLIDIPVYTPPVPLSASQTLNFEIEETARRSKPYCIHMHNDADIPEGACEALLEFTRKTTAENPRWGVIFTHYDVFCVYNPETYKQIGGFDTNLPQYFCDNDWYRRLQLAGWATIDSHIQVGHVGSQTIKSDKYLHHVNHMTFPLYLEYYRRKWGGEPRTESFTHPFGVLPKEWKLP